METDLHTLPSDTDDLQRRLREAVARCSELDTALRAEQAENERLREQLRLYLWKRFGPSSERSNQDQLQLFNESELLAGGGVDEAEFFTATDAEPPAIDNPTLAIADTATRPRRGRRPLPAWMVRRRVVHDLPALGKCCHQREALLAQIGEESTEHFE